MSLEDVERASRIIGSTSSSGTTPPTTTTTATTTNTTTTTPTTGTTPAGGGGVGVITTTTATTTTTSGTQDDLVPGGGTRCGIIMDPEEEDASLDDRNISTLFHNQIRFHHLAAATGLIVTYVIEIIVQVFLVFHSCGVLGTVTSAGWNWSIFLASSSLLSALVVTVVSMVWVCRGLDFAGRLCGRFLCYVMHSLLLGLLWRYLKLAFVYDRADVQEFVALRIFQAYFQSLPLTSIHLAWLISSRENWSSSTVGIILMEFLSIVTALILSSYLRSDDDQRRVESQRSQMMQIIVDNLNYCSSSSSKSSSSSSSSSSSTTSAAAASSSSSCKHEQGSPWPQLLETKLTFLGRSLLLCSRIIVLGIIMVHLKYWTCLFFLVHLTVSITWISFSLSNHSSADRTALLQEMEEVSLTKGKDSVTVIMEWAYVLFWDVMSIPSAINLCTWILPVLLVLLENGTVVLVNWVAQEEQVGVTIISGTCLLLGWLLFSSLTLVNSYAASGARNGGGGKVSNCCTPRPVKKDVKTGMTKDKGQQTQVSSVIDPMIKYPPSTHPHHHPHPHPHHHPHHHSNGHGIPSFFHDKSLTKMVTSDSFKYSDKKGISPPGLDLHRNVFTPAAAAATAAAAPFLHTLTTHMNENLLTRVKAHPVDSSDKTQLGVRIGRRSKEDSAEAARNYVTSNLVGPRGLHHHHQQQRPQSPVPAAPTWVSDTCCNDSNGSSNSRNTNTLRDPGHRIPEDLLDDPDDLDNSKFVFYFPTDTSAHSYQQQQQQQHHHHHHHHHHHQQQQQHQQQRHQSVTPARLPKCDPSSRDVAPPPPLILRPTPTGFTEDSSEMMTTMMMGRKGRKKVRSSSISSFRNVRHYRISTPVEIKKAARIAVYGSSQAATRNLRDPSGGGGGKSPYHCDADKSQPRPEILPPYEQLMEDSYGILICESDPTPEANCPVLQRSRTDFHPQINPTTHHQPPMSSMFSNSGSKKLRVLCAKCLRNHDPLLTNCLETDIVYGRKPQQHQQQQQHQHQQQHEKCQLIHRSPHSFLSHATASKVGRSGLNSSSSLPRTPPILDVTNSIGDDDDDVDDDDDDDNNNNNSNNNNIDEEDDEGADVVVVVGGGGGGGDDEDECDEVDDGDEEDPVPSDTTEYPSETEMTCTLEGDDQLSVSTNLSTATYTTWPHQSQPNLSMWTTSTMMPHSRFPKEFTGLEYVRTWLLTSQARLRQLQQHQQQQQQQQQQQHQQRQQYRPPYEARGRLAKRVYRSNTLAAQSRKVRFVNSVMTSTKDSRQCHTGKRLAGSRGPSIHVVREERVPSVRLTFQPPPRQKQHPSLPHRLVPHPSSKGHRVHPSKGPPTSLQPSSPPASQSPDFFHKDVEIIL